MKTTVNIFENMDFQAATLEVSAPFLISFKGHRKDHKPVSLRRWLQDFTPASRRTVMQLFRDGLKKGKVSLAVQSDMPGPAQQVDAYWKYSFTDNVVNVVLHDGDLITQTPVVKPESELQMPNLGTITTDRGQDQLTELHIALQGANLGFWVWELESDLLQINTSWARMVGLLPGQIKHGADFFNLLHPDDHQVVSNAIEAYQKGRTCIYTCRFRLQHSNGHHLHIEASGAHMYRTNYKGERVLCLVGIHRDISDEIERQRELKESHQRTLHLSQLKSKFLANVSHEVRTPIHGVHNLLTLLKSNKDSTKRDEIINEVQSVIDGLGYLLDGLTDFAYIESGSFTPKQNPVKLKQLLNTTRQFFHQETRKKGLKLRVAIDPNLEIIHYTDEKMLAEILLELTGNAIKYTDSGSIDVRCSLLERSEHPNNPGHMYDFIEIKITDDGAGLPDRIKKHLFEPFFNKDFNRVRSETGLGVGLVLVKTYVHALAGTLDVQSTPGQGTVVTVRLTLKGHEEANIAASIRPHFLKRCHGEINKVLVVDDVSINRRILKTQLTQYGFEVVVAEDGLAALNLFDDPSFTCDLILMDIQMPRLDGISCTAKLRSEYGIGEPILGITADATADTEQDGLDAGMDEVLFKPVDIQKLAATISAHNNTFRDHAAMQVTNM